MEIKNYCKDCGIEIGMSAGSWCNTHYPSHIFDDLKKENEELKEKLRIAENTIKYLEKQHWSNFTK